jgi:cytochrome b6-f complex iron-sulfur subunit
VSSTTILLIAIPVLVLLAAALLVGAARRRDTGEAIGHLSRETRRRDRDRVAETPLAPDASASGRDVERRADIERRQPSTEIERAPSAAPVPYVPPDPDTVGVTRRQFLNRSIVNVMGFSVTAFGLACIGFLWPSSAGGFGSKIRVGNLDDIKQGILDGNGFFYVPEARTWITEYPAAALDKARRVYDPAILTGMEAGIVALYQKCPHLGCRVPSCETSQWFECPCHGSQYNQVGEKKGGPAPRGMDRFPVEISGGSVTVNTGLVIQGPPIGTNTTGQEAEGPHCIGSAGGHG